MVNDKSEGQTAVGLDPIFDGVQPDLLQQGRAAIARQKVRQTTT